MAKQKTLNFCRTCRHATLHQHHGDPVLRLCLLQPQGFPSITPYDVDVASRPACSRYQADDSEKVIEIIP